MPFTARDLEAKKRVALRRLRECESVVVALSGGVDSAVLLGLAREALGRDRVLAATGRSASLAASDLAAAREVARSLGVAHEVVETREMERAGYRANAGDRCLHCRNELFAVLGAVARRGGYRKVAYGAIVDDLGEHRPGMEAAQRLGVAAPLLEAGLGKPDIRALAVAMGLGTVRDKPASACLASRIPTGTPVSAERLAQVEAAEAALARLGLGQLRVRHHGDLARIELDGPGLQRLLDGSLRKEVVQAVQEAGFRFVTVDIEGYRAGGASGPSDDP